MTVTGIIAEYNPFHLGHAYHLSEARRLTGADYIVVIMSGDYVQRGEPALFDKYTRTRMALQGGADLVIELPVSFSTAGSVDFAGGAVAILDKLGVIDYLVFGSETGDLDSILAAADRLKDESEETGGLIRQGLKDGLSYPAAVAQAHKTILSSQDDDKTNLSSLSDILSTPNNLLGVEYCRALKRRSSAIRPMTIKRMGDYHGQEMDGPMPSASAIRRVFAEHSVSESISQIRSAIPSGTYDQMVRESGISGPIFTDDFTDALFYRLLNENEETLCRYLDVSADLAGRIKNTLSSCRTYTELAASVKCKSYTRLRINRSLLHCLLGLTDEKMTTFKSNDYTGYARILGFKDTAAPLIGEIAARSSLSILLRMKEDGEKLSATDRKLLELNNLSSALYRMTIQRKFGHVLPEEYSRRLIRI